jgi:predicted dienelactone hydrolase
MASLILLIALVIEASFTTYCIVTQSNQEKGKSYIRMGALVAFILFTLISVIEWNFTLYLLAALLFLWALLGARSLLRKPVEKKGFKALPAVFRAIGTLLLVFISVTPALIFPQHPKPPVTGNHPVATALFTYINPNQTETFTSTGEKRRVNVEFWYPKDATGGETYPLVVFSHGSMGMKSQNTSTFLDLASNGYVVCSIDNPYIALFTQGSDGRLIIQSPSIRQELYKLNNHDYDEVKSLQIQHAWMAVQSTDINFVLDTIQASGQDSSSSAVYHLIDVKKIGLMGHSLGGESSAQTARERIASGKNDIGAVVDLDADPSGEYVDVVNGKPVLDTTTYPVPILFILSDAFINGFAAIPDAADVIALKHVVATAPEAYEVDMAGTNHMSFTDLALSSPVLTYMLNSSFHANTEAAADPMATIEKMNATVLQFFNVYLKREGSFTIAALK